MSLVKEFPLNDITAAEYAIGSAGGPLANLALLSGSLWLYKKRAGNPRVRMVLSALILANVFYFLIRGVLSLLKQSGGELSAVAGLIGLGYGMIVFLYAMVCILALYYWMNLAGIRLSLRTVGSFMALLVGYLFLIVGLEAIDQSLFWKRFPTIQIDDGRTYNQHDR